MKNLNLDDGKIRLAGKWYTADDLTRAIQSKIQAGDMKFAELAAALERLNVALENSHRLEVRLVISKEEYAELKKLGGMDDRECVRKAIMSFIGYDVGVEKMRKKKTAATGQQPVDMKPGEAQKTEKTHVNCFKCKSPMEIKPGDETGEIYCPNCSSDADKSAKASLSDSQVRYKDHFLG